MQFSSFDKTDSEDVINLFSRTFSASEGKENGNIIGELVKNLIHTTSSEDLIGCVAKNNQAIVGGVFFSRFDIADTRTAFILSPMAIAPDVQGMGIGQELIKFGIAQLSSHNIDILLTYGDPAFYSKVGFSQISEDVIKAPFKLSQPIGWLAQSLNDKPLIAIPGATQCVKALSDAKYW